MLIIYACFRASAIFSGITVAVATNRGAGAAVFRTYMTVFCLFAYFVAANIFLHDIEIAAY